MCNKCEGDNPFQIPMDFIGMAIMIEHMRVEHNITNSLTLPIKKVKKMDDTISPSVCDHRWITHHPLISPLAIVTCAACGAINWDAFLVELDKYRAAMLNYEKVKNDGRETNLSQS